jgi:isopenicillin N synthase-like dioxygenase
MASEIPRIDLGLAAASSGGLAGDVVERVAEACRVPGFFQVSGHGIDASTLERLRTEMRRFFAEPREHKRTLLRTRDRAWGYYDSEYTKNTLDWKEVFDFGRLPRPDLPDEDPANVGLDGTNRWPESLPGFRAAMLDYLDACETLAFRLLEAMCLGLGLRGDRLHEFFQPHHSSFVRLNHYPRCADPAPADADDVPARGQLGVNRHRDAGALTLLAQTDVTGLQVRCADGWLGVDPLPDALVVNVGDMMQVWSNDRYQSPLHRVVVTSNDERYSAPFFFNPSYDALCAPLPELVQVDGRPRYRPIRWGEFRSLRAAGDYADIGEEVQVEHYRL